MHFTHTHTQHARTRIHLTYVALHEVTWCMVVWCTQNVPRDGSSFMWHQPCQRCKYTTSVDIQKLALKDIHSCRITCERSESARRRRIALYKSDHQPVNQSILTLVRFLGAADMEFFSQSQLSVQTLLRCSCSPLCNSMHQNLYIGE